MEHLQRNFAFLNCWTNNYTVNSSLWNFDCWNISDYDCLKNKRETNVIRDLKERAFGLINIIYEFYCFNVLLVIEIRLIVFKYSIKF